MKQAEDIKNAVEVLRRGGVILYPTDTVWGIGCDATNAEAVAKVYKIKQRDDSKAMICLVDSDARLQRYVREVPAVAWDLFELADKPTTVILGSQSYSRRRFHRYAHHSRRVFQRTVLPFPEGLGKHQRQYKRTASRRKLLRHITRDTRRRRLCLLLTPTRAQASYTFEHHQTRIGRRG